MKYKYVSIIIILLITIFNSIYGIDIVKPLIETLMKISDESWTEGSTNNYLRNEYDFIIVGAGIAGTVLANRLSENPNWNVLLIEAGDSESSIMDIPLMADYLQLTKVNWKFDTEPSSEYCLGMNQGRCPVPRGKVLGGSSILDYMTYYRGQPSDYDAWAKLGNKGWAFEDIFKYFEKIEKFEIKSTEMAQFPNRNGQVNIGYPTYLSKLGKTLIDVAKDLNIYTHNYNDNITVGMSYCQDTIKDGERLSANKAYLRPIKHRDNLTVKKSTAVTRILINPETKRAYGVQLDNEGFFFKPTRVRANKEVILAAGTVGTPKLLMLSGIGPRLHLLQNDIDVVQDLKVGYNLMDQVGVGGIIFGINQSTAIKVEDVINLDDIKAYILEKEGPMSVPGGLEVCSFHNTNEENNSRPNIGLYFMSTSTLSNNDLRKIRGIRDDIYKSSFQHINPENSFMIIPTLLRPKSRGRIMLRNNNYHFDPLIYPHYFSDPSDLPTLIKGIHIMLNITSHNGLQKLDVHINKKKIYPCKMIPFGSDNYWACLAQVLTFSMHQLSGTCKMGSSQDEDAVVNPELKVYGIQNLRVVDASVIPDMISGPIGAAVYMIAEKAADMIKNEIYDK